MNRVKVSANVDNPSTIATGSALDDNSTRLVNRNGSQSLSQITSHLLTRRMHPLSCVPRRPSGAHRFQLCHARLQRSLHRWPVMLGAAPRRRACHHIRFSARSWQQSNLTRREGGTILPATLYQRVATLLICLQARERQNVFSQRYRRNCARRDSVTMRGQRGVFSSP